MFENKQIDIIRDSEPSDLSHSILKLSGKNLLKIKKTNFLR